MQNVSNNPKNISSQSIISAINGSSWDEVDKTRLEALSVLSNSLLEEIQSLKREQNKYLNVKIDLSAEVQNYEISLIRCALMRTGGNQRRAARLLSIKVTTLNNKIKRLGICPNGLSLK